ncbi:putative E3 ubiquitin-protein ligase [Gracilariopsis chorda]|uniref:Putative E3 ubiquitin-protein ligase n=1 Tax=Gracilariopsis chorda TaxID=448386 RepID=A0A2V3J2M0_9FLOR|nr:putative E3 ubiquitin-protein ligase [Gracilariopsis chorda]|eukprot:PXF48696.1 putative E3 ubiquitin-protein ligase [Gracilariopsis chorda]
MDKLFAVRVLVHYYDKPKVDHEAVRRLLSAAGVESLNLRCTDGTTTKLSDHVNASHNTRKSVAEVLGSSGASLVQVASIFMLAEARAASDSLCTSPGELEVTCSALERLLDFLHRTSPSHPALDVRHSGRMKTGPGGYRRTLYRLSRSAISDASQVSILKAVNAVLRLCDVATHCLAVVSRQSLTSKASCEIAVNLSTRLLTLASSLYNIQRKDSKPSLSFFSSNSLRTALVSGAMHLGAITVEHVTIDAMSWVQVANRILVNNGRTTITPRVSILSALFGELDMTRESQDQLSSSNSGTVDINSASVTGRQEQPSNVSSSQGSLSQAARSFLGERVVAAEEDGDEGRIAAGTVYHACEEYAERTGETEGIIGLLVRLFEAAGRHFCQESADESVVSISEGTLPCPPDESDDCSEDPPLRQDLPLLPSDQVDIRFRDLFGYGMVSGSPSEVCLEQNERIEMHKEIGALALDTLAKWLQKVHSLRRYKDIDVINVARLVCSSASMFLFNGSSASYDLRAAMVDFASYIGPELGSHIKRHPIKIQEDLIQNLIKKLLETCQRSNPILSGIIGSCQTEAVIQLLVLFQTRGNLIEVKTDRNDEGQGLPPDGILSLILTVVTAENALVLLRKVTEFLKELFESEKLRDTPVSHVTALLLLLSFSTSVSLGIVDGLDIHRVAIAALFHRDTDQTLEPLYPEGLPENEDVSAPRIGMPVSLERKRVVRDIIENGRVRDLIRKTFALFCPELARAIQVLSSSSFLASGVDYVQEASALKEVKSFFHLYWSAMMVTKVLHSVEVLEDNCSQTCATSQEEFTSMEVLSPFVIEQASRNPKVYSEMEKFLRDKQSSTIAMLYPIDCTVLYHCSQRESQTKDSKWLLSSVIRTCVDCIENTTYKDVPENYIHLLHSFQKSPLEDIRGARQEANDRRKIFARNAKEIPVCAAIQLAMFYVRSIGSGNISHVLASAFVSASEFIEHIPREELKEMRNLIIPVASHLIFVSQLSAELAFSMWLFIDTFLCKSFDLGPVEENYHEGLISFLARTCGFAKLAEKDTSSPRVIRALCLFARDTALVKGLEDVLQLVSLQNEIPEDIPNGDLRQWLRVSLPRVSLTNFLTSLLVPVDESAVAVSLHGESFAFLTTASEQSTLWRDAVLSGLGMAYRADPTFWERTIIRSIVESATLNDGVLSMVEKVMGIDDSKDASCILLDLFKANCKVFESSCNVGIEGKCRMLNFAVRVTLCYGRVAARCSNQISPPLLEPALFQFLLSALKQTSEGLLVSPKDEASKHLVLFLCDLLACIETGLSTCKNEAENVSDSKSLSKKTSHDSSEPRQVNNSLLSELRQSAPRGSNDSVDVEAHPLCTYTTTGSQFVEQHWYFCYSCDLSGSEGVCSTCARICHRGCELAYSKFSRFFCDCGAGSDSRQESVSHGVASSEDGEESNANAQDPNLNAQQLSTGRLRKRKVCNCLKRSDRSETKQDTGIQAVRGNAPRTQEEHEVFLGSQLEEKLTSELRSLSADKTSLRGQHRKRAEDAFRATLKDSVSIFASTALFLTRELEGTHVARQSEGMWAPLSETQSAYLRMVKAADYSKEVFQDHSVVSTKILRPNSLDVSKRTDLSRNSFYPRGSVIAYSCFERIFAVAQKSNCIEFIDASEDIFSARGPSEKIASRTFRKVNVPFDINHIEFHPANSNLLLVVGKEKVLILVRVGGAGSHSWNRVEVEVGLSEYHGYNGENSLVEVSWIDEDATLLLVVTTDFVKIFDVAVDTFCPCFFARTPKHNGTSQAEHHGDKETAVEAKTSKPKIVAAAFARDSMANWKDRFLVFVLTSDAKLFVTRSKRHQATPPEFDFCFEVRDDDGQHVSLNNMLYYAEESLFLIFFSSGNVLCVPFSVRTRNEQLEGMIRGPHLFKKAFEADCLIGISPVKGHEKTFLYCEKQKVMGCSGLLVLGQGTLTTQSLSAAPSTSVLGCHSYSASPFVGESSRAGGFFLIDDGSVQRLDISFARVRSQIQQQTLLSAAIERHRKWSLSVTNDQTAVLYNSSIVPPAVGFFEKCRPVSDTIRFEGTESDTKKSVDYDRMSVVLAGGGSECIVSPTENQPFRFTAIIDNQSLVLVGARMRFGGTDRSRHRVPVEVKVFGRTVRWNARNGVKRWLDIPFSIPESIKSPHKVSFELLPRRMSREGRVKIDGLCAIDALELYAVSNIEFTERKLLHEKAKSQSQNHRNEKEDDGYNDLRFVIGNAKDLCCATKPAPSEVLSRDQMALVTVLNNVERQKFLSSPKAGALLFEVNNMWSRSSLQPEECEQTFLEYLIQPCITLCLPDLLKPRSSQPEKANELVLKVVSSGTRTMILDHIVSCYENGILPHFRNVEKCLFMMATMARALFAAGTDLPQTALETWAASYDELMPPQQHSLLLLKAYINMGRTGRLLLSSLDGVAIDAVDVFMTMSVRQNISEHQSSRCDASRVIVEMLCSFDQRLRLTTAQRLTELFDNLNSPTGELRNPFEAVLTHSLSRALIPEKEKAKATDVKTARENESICSDEAPRWAYRCDSCREVCDQEWWHCADCEDFDLCTKCLRSSSPCFTETHQEDHVLLRGTIEQDVEGLSICANDQVITSVIGKKAQEILSTVITKILEQVMAEESNSTHWRYLDAAEAISQLLGSRSPLALKPCRLTALFSSSFPSLLRNLAEGIGNDYQNAKVGNDGMLSVTPRCSDIFILMLCILLCASGSGMAAFVHKHGVPSVLLALLQKLHPKLQELAFHVNSSDSEPVKRLSNVDLMSSSAWNKTHPGLTYQVLSRRKASRDDSISDVFVSSQSFGSSNGTFLNIMIESIHLLEFSFRSASNYAILQQMKCFPRKVLCDIINFCDSCQSKHDPALMKTLASSSEKLLCVLSMDNTDELNDVLDRYLYDEQCRRLHGCISKRPQLGCTMPYESALEIALILENIRKAARRHPETWRNFVITDTSIIDVLLKIAKQTKGKLQANTLQLVSAGLSLSTEYATKVMNSASILNVEHYDADSDQDVRLPFKTRTENVGDTKYTREALGVLLKAAEKNPQVPSSSFTGDNFDLLRFLLFEVLLKSHNRQSRLAAADIITFVTARAASNAAEHRVLIATLNASLRKALGLMPYAGSLSDGVMTCLLLFVTWCQSKSFGSDSESYLSSLTTDLALLLIRNCKLLTSHPNARLYGRLSSVLEINGYYLEADPCLTCAATTWESSEVRESRLETIKAETKYTDCSIMHRLLSPHEISSVSLKVIDPRRTRRAKKIDVYYSSRSVSDAAELKAQSHPWKRLKSLDLTPSTTECVVDLIVPIQTANIRFEFSDFYDAVEVHQSSISSESDQNDAVISPGVNEAYRNARAAESLQCPRCSRAVTDRHGICRNCHENAYQCRQCRNINYENLDGFLCNECGYCKHGRFEFSVIGKPAYITEPVLNEEDRRRASEVIEKETANVHRCMEQLSRIRSAIIRSLSTGSPVDQSREKGRVPVGSRFFLGDIVPPRAEMAMLEALFDGQVSHEVEETANSTQGGVSITEDVIGDGNGSVEVHEREQSHQTGSNSASPLNRIRRADTHQNPPPVEQTFLSKTTSALGTIYGKECRAIYSGMSRGVRILTMTRSELVRYANSIDENRLKHANDMFQASEEDQLSNKDMLRSEDGSSQRSQPCCYNCTQSFVANSVKLLQTILDDRAQNRPLPFSSQLVKHVLQVCSQCERHDVRLDIHHLITSLVRDNTPATKLVCEELARKIVFCIESWETVDPHTVARFDIAILESISSLDDSCWEERLRLVMTILFKASRQALTCSSVAESIILPCLHAALRILREDVGLCNYTNDQSGSASVLDIGLSSDEPVLDMQVSQDSNNTLDSNRIPSSIASQSDQRFIVRESLVQSSTIQGRNQQRIIGDNRAVSSHVASDSNQDENISPSQGGELQTSETQDENRDRLSHSTQDKSDESTDTAISTSNEGEPPMGEDGLHMSTRSTGYPEFTMPISEVRRVLEDVHDRRLATADITDWLTGNSSQSIWTARLMREKGSIEARDQGVTLGTGDERNLLKSCLRVWKAVVDAQVGSQFSFKALSLEENNWLVRLMLFTPCTAVRKECCTLLELLCNDEETLRLQLLDVLTGNALNLGAMVEDMSQEYFDLLENMLVPETHRVYLISKGFLPRLTGLIRSMAERLVVSEAKSDTSMRLVSFMEGYSLKRLISVFGLFIEVISSQQTALREKLFGRNDNGIVSSLQRAYLCLRKLISMRTTLTEECGSRLCDILLSKKFLFFGSSISSVVSACVDELKAAKARNDAQGIAILLDELCLMLCPERKEPTCMLSLNKAPTQEEFIRGNMARNPYVSSSFDGPLMRDVKNKICRDLDLPGLLEDDFAMELLVAGNLIKLDLPIMGVYEHIWRGSAAAAMASSIQPGQLPRTIGLRRASQAANGGGFGGSSRTTANRAGILSFRRAVQDRNSGDVSLRSEELSEPPMVVIYRLSGLDGEATEPIVESLPSESKLDHDTEAQFRDTVILGKVGGLDLLFELLSVVESWGDDAETAVRAPALRLLLASCEVAENKATLARSPNAVNTLLDCAASAFEHAQGSPAAVKSAESLLIAAEQILAQQRRDLEACTTHHQDAMHIEWNSPTELISRVRVFLGRLSLATSLTAENSILHLLPFLVQGNADAIDQVLRHMQFDWDAIDSSDVEQKKARQLGTVLLAIPTDLRGNEFIAHTVLSGLGERAVSYIVERFPIPRNENRTQWQQSLEGRGPPLILRLITGMSLFFGSSQGRLQSNDVLRDCFHKQDKTIAVLCQVEMAVSENSVGSSAEELLEALSRDTLLKIAIDKERESIKSARREAARLSRMTILKETGLDFSGLQKDNQEQGKTRKKRDETTSETKTSLLKLMEELPDESGPSCVVCGDGFQCRPEEALALYVHCRKVSLDLSSTSDEDSRVPGTNERRTETFSMEPRLEWDVWANGSSRSGSAAISKGSSSSCFTAVTHMNAIHLTCHKEAARIDRNSRRDEWDGASLRNSQTRCNNMFPVRPPASMKLETDGELLCNIKTAKVSYCTAVEGYFKRLASLGRVSIPQSKAVLYDLGRSLLRFADGRSTVFSEYSHGGERIRMQASFPIWFS